MVHHTRFSALRVLGHVGLSVAFRSHGSVWCDSDLGGFSISGVYPKTLLKAAF